MRARKVHMEVANMIGKYIREVVEIIAAVTFTAFLILVTGAAVMVILFSFRLVLEVFAL